MTLSQITIRTAQPHEYSRVAGLYQRWGYDGGLLATDSVYIAEVAGQIVGIVRRTIEHDVVMLRGMQVDPAHQHRGVGTQLLHALVAGVDGQECFCIPFDHLTAFYRQGGFEVLPEAAAPRFLIDRLARYRQAGHKVMVVRRPAGQDRDRAG